MSFVVGQRVRHQDGQEGEVVHVGYQDGLPLLHVQLVEPDARFGRPPIRIDMHEFWEGGGS